MNDEPLIIVPDASDYYSFELNDIANATDDEFQAMITLNQATTNWVHRSIDTAEYTDVLSHYDVNPDAYLNDMDWYLNELIRLS